jgi:Domain of unknown function (DUF1833)
MVDNLSQAIAEAYASAPTDEVVLDTLELRHPSFDTTARIVRDYGTFQYTSTDDAGFASDVYGHVLTLESDAPLNANETVLFQACMFDFTFMEQRDGQLPELQISIDNVTHLLGAALDEAALSGHAIAVTYREYVASDMSEPGFILDGLTLQRVTAKTFRLVGSAGFFDIINVNFPNRVYDLDTFPGLIGST